MLPAALRTGGMQAVQTPDPLRPSRAEVPLGGQREPTDGSLVRRAGHGEGHVAGAVWCAAFSDRLPYRQTAARSKSFC
jgi:hypothetical protein